MPAETYQPRLVDELLARRVRHHPAVLVVGPRAAGKTTSVGRLARSAIKLDEGNQAAVVKAGPDAALRGLPEPILVDEWQVVPEVLGAIKRATDDDPRPGRFLVTGSVRGEVATPTWPGTGRLIRVRMYGLTISEVERRIPETPLLDRLAAGDLSPLVPTGSVPLDLRDYAELAATGGFPVPALRLPVDERVPWLDSYLDQLVTRDIPSLATNGHARSPHLLRRYLEAYALNTAGTPTQQTLYGAAGIAKSTGEAYQELLAALFAVEDVPGCFTNRLRRLVTAPKRYVVDPALALAALRVDVAGLMRDGDLLGRILDTFVMSQLRAELSRCASRPRLFHLRQEQGRHEVDILVEYGGGRVFGFEVKATGAPSAADARHLVWLREALGDRFVGGAVLHTGPRGFDLGERIVAAPIAVLWS